MGTNLIRSYSARVNVQAANPVFLDIAGNRAIQRGSGKEYNLYAPSSKEKNRVPDVETSVLHGPS